MASILVPVDYSTACHNAYRFALHLADDMGLDVVLAHYYSGSIDPRASLSIGGDGTIQGGFEARLRQFAYSADADSSTPLVEPPCGVAVTYETEVSLQPTAAIIKRAGREDISLVVMATRSSDALLGKWLGSTSITVSEACARPVYLIPPDANCRPFRRMVVANNHATADPYSVRELEELAELYDAEVHFVHVDQSEGDVPLRFKPWQLMGAASSVAFPFEVIDVEDKDISRGLMDYAEDIEADLLVVVNQTRSRWQALLRATLTQDLALRSRLPVLVLHVAAQAAPSTLSSQYPTLPTA